MTPRTPRVLVVGACLCLAATPRAEDVTPVEPPEQAREESGGSLEEPPSNAADTVRLQEILVEADRAVSAASAQDIRARDFQLRPHSTMNQILNNVPGLVVAQHQGGSKAAQYFLRGFDADHGTDVAVFVDDLPVNFVTHAHGQGYADLNFVIPETLESLRLYKGPYFVQYGDFATAGALNLVSKTEFKENFVLAEGGSFANQRYVLGASPRLGPVKTLLAAQARYANGPFDDPENLAGYNGYGKLTLDPTPGSTLSLAATGYQADWDASGQIPQSLVSSGQLDRFGSLDPTEGGRTERENLDLKWRYTPTPLDTWDVHGYATRYKLRLWSDFTFFKNTGLRFVRLPDGRVVDTGEEPVRPGADYIPGDGIYQGDARVMYGGRARYTRTWDLGGIPLQSQVGIETRNDEAHVTLKRQVRRESFFTVNDVYVQVHSFSGYWGQQVFPTEWLRFDGGLRGDFFVFDVRNRLPAQGPDPNFTQVLLDGRTTEGTVSPKANLIFGPFRNTELYLDFGRGFHSNDARAAIGGADFTGVTDPGTGVPEERTVVPLATALGYELGARTRQFDRLDVAAALWRLTLDSELVFSGDAGTDEPSPASNRWGIDFELRYQILRWLTADYDLSWVRARFDEGGFVPLAPDLLMNGGLTARFDNGFGAALRMRYVDDRPANEDGSVTAQGYFLLDLIGSYRWRNVEAAVTIFNLTNTEWNEAQFADTVCTRQGLQDRNPGGACFVKPGRNAVDPPDQLTFTPGSPIGVRAGITVFF